MSNRGRKRCSETKEFWCLCSICFPIGARKNAGLGPQAVRTFAYETCVDHCRKHGFSWREVNLVAWEAQGAYPAGPAGPPAPPSSPPPANRSPRSGARLASSPLSPPSTCLRLNSACTPTRSTQSHRLPLLVSSEEQAQSPASSRRSLFNGPARDRGSPQDDPVEDMGIPAEILQGLREKQPG
ncbi:hypothetical protein DUNSADRAFT_5554, partial [Dunaliella salina]